MTLHDVDIPPAMLAALDAWIAERAAQISEPETLSRPEALRRLAAEALISMGLLPLGRPSE